MIKKFPYKIIDLTHTLSSDIPTWNGACGFSHEIKKDYDTRSEKVPFRVQQIKMHAGVGTHIDAPSHCIPGGKNVGDIPLEELVAPCVVIDVSKKAEENYIVSNSDLIAFEEKFAPISEGSFVIVHTGWSKFWNNPKKYCSDYRFPSLSREFAEALLERKIVGVGIDTLSPDRPDSGFPVHELILGAGKYIVENIANAMLLPPISSFSLALPIKTVDGTEAPIRLVGLIDF